MYLQCSVHMRLSYANSKYFNFDFDVLTVDTAMRNHIPHGITNVICHSPAMTFSPLPQTKLVLHVAQLRCARQYPTQAEGS